MLSILSFVGLGTISYRLVRAFYSAISLEQLTVVTGRLAGLAGTIRYDLPELLRIELRELVEMLASIHLPIEVSQ